MTWRGAQWGWIEGPWGQAWGRVWWVTRRGQGLLKALRAPAGAVLLGYLSGAAAHVRTCQSKRERLARQAIRALMWHAKLRARKVALLGLLSENAGST